MKKISALFLVLFLLTGYIPNNNSFNLSKKDVLLKIQIYGSWMHNSNKITFFKNSSFTDSIYILGNTGVAKFLYSKTGTYYIRNSVLILKTDEWNFSECVPINCASLTPDNFTLQIDGSDMIWDGKIELTKCI